MIKLLNNQVSFFLKDKKISYSLDDIYDCLYQAIKNTGSRDLWIAEDLSFSIEEQLSQVLSSKGFLLEEDFLGTLSNTLRFNGFDDVLDYLHKNRIFFSYSRFDESRVSFLQAQLSFSYKRAFDLYLSVKYKLRLLDYNFDVDRQFLLSLAREQLKQEKEQREKDNCLSFEKKVGPKEQWESFIKASLGGELFLFLRLDFDLFEFCQSFSDALLLMVYEENFFSYLFSGLIPNLKGCLKDHACDYITLYFHSGKKLEGFLGKDFYLASANELKFFIEQEFPSLRYVKLNFIVQ